MQTKHEFDNSSREPSLGASSSDEFVNLERQFEQHLEQREYTEALSVLENPNFDVNALDVDNEWNLLMTAISHASSDPEPELDAVIEAILSHPKFTRAQYLYINDTAFDKAIKSISVSVVKIFFKYPERVGLYLIQNHNGELQYEVIKKRLAYLEDSLKNQTGARAKSTQRIIDEFKQILAIVRDATIRHAIATDDPTWIARLGKAGDNYANFMLDGSDLWSIVREPGKEQRYKNILAWSDRTLKEAVAFLTGTTTTFFKAQDEFKAKQEQLNATAAEYNRQSAEIHQRRVRNHGEFLEVVEKHASSLAPA